MSEEDRTGTYRGGCLCGAVRYLVTAEPLNVRLCHCRLCRKATGQPFFARAAWAREAVVIEGETAGYNSSSDLVRRFCPTCGTGLFAQRQSRPDLLSITLGSLDDPSRIKPAMHIWTSSQMDWLTFDDGLPRYEQGAPA